MRRWLFVVATVVALAASLAPAAARPAAAAGDALTLSAATTYTLQPANHVVRVSLDLTATNNKPDTTAGGIVTRYFYQGARLAIQAEARNVRATTGATRLTATVKPGDGYAILEVHFKDGLFYQQSTTARITFDLPGGAPRSVAFCHRIGLDYVSCSPYRVPLARLAAAQAALKEVGVDAAVAGG